MYPCTHRGLAPCDQAIEVGGEGRIQRAAGVPGLHAARARRVVGDDDWGQTSVVRLAQLRFDERAVFGVPERRLARGEQSARCAAVSDRAHEVGDLAPCLVVRPVSFDDPVEQEIGPQRGADEVQAVDRDGLPVEQRHAVALALSGELAARILDVASIEFVAPIKIR